MELFIVQYHNATNQYLNETLLKIFWKSNKLSETRTRANVTSGSDLRSADHWPAENNYNKALINSQELRNIVLVSCIPESRR